MFGILNVNKPVGWSSRDAVNRIERHVRPAKVGHAGTLDPLATGVLAVCVGPATRLISYVQQLPKAYRATFMLGRSSPSDDIETEVIECAVNKPPSLFQIEAQLPNFVGTIQQRPPAYSALKVHGQRAYKLARQGKAVNLQPRPVDIYHLAIEAYEYPSLTLSIRCGSGTYVRSLGRDLADALGTRSVMSALTRTAIGGFALKDAVDIKQLDAEHISNKLISPLAAVAHLPQISLNDQQWVELQHGRRIPSEEFEVVVRSPTEVFAAVDPSGALVALVRERRPGLLGSICNFAQPAHESMSASRARSQ